MKGRKILVGITGSIAAYRVCDLMSELRKKGADLSCVMTRSATEFITPLTIRSLSGGKVYTDLFQDYDGVLHTTLADESEIILIMPASANVIARLANGFADDLLTSVVLASKSPVLVVPAMNDNMFRNAFTQDNIKKLASAGFGFVEPVKGPLVCGREEVGHIAPTEAILSRLESALKRS
ncbi:MAG: hypothetical protein HY714_03475 [Candidatus Omnitrophica bacterium]|nr:hypothetical protein [Candidatus Omnitrophota bacterium]